MAESILIEAEIADGRHRNVGTFLEIPFRPRAGRVELRGLAVPKGAQKDAKGKADPRERFDTLTIPTGALELSIFSPDSAEPVATKRISATSIAETPDEEPLSVTVAENAKEDWRCRVKNTGLVEAICTGTVKFPYTRRPIETTKIPISLLNHAARTALEAIGPDFEIEDNRLIVRFRGEAADRLGLETITEELDFSIDLKLKRVQVLEIESLALESASLVAMASPNGRPQVRIKVTTGDLEADSVGGTDMDASPLSLTIDIEFISTGTRSVRVNADTGDETLHGHRLAWPHVSVDARGLSLSLADLIVTGAVAGAPIPISGSAVIGAGVALLGKGEIQKTIRNRIEGRVSNALGAPEVRAALADHFTRALQQLARKDHLFHRVTADADRFEMAHYDPGRLPIEPGDVSELPQRVGGRLRRKPLERAPEDGLEALQRIENIVVLMMENRSFDHMLGYLSLDEGRTDIEGLSGTESNRDETGARVKVQPLGPADTVFADTTSGVRVLFDIEHSHTSIKKQIAQGRMSGFVTEFEKRNKAINNRFVMGYFLEEQVPAYDFFSKEFLICDHWYASHPGPTWPNRFCSLSGEMPRRENFEVEGPEVGYVTMPTLFDLLSRDQWIYYEHDISFLRMYDRYRLDVENILAFNDSRDGFFARARQGTLPPVTWIDPSFSDVPGGGVANDDHPPVDITNGQRLVCNLYNALRASTQWPGTMFVITYDEHGGLFDHVPPPGTPRSGAPDATAKLHPKGPEHLGVRVPSFVISPWVEPGSVSHASFDHTSLIKTILLRFGGEGELPVTKRVRETNHLGVTLTRKKPRLTPPPCNMPGAPDPHSAGAEAQKVASPEKDPRDFHEAMRRFGVPSRRP